ncbi:MAG TPA: hypothetical protein VF677_13745 [Flavobacterium sp.]|jgi:hypothetical protein
MKKFIKKLAIITAIIFILLFCLDILYTEVYVHSYPRNKTKYVLQLKNKKIDYIFLGSSRVENHIDTKLVNKLTLKKALNLGVQGAKLDDNYLLLKLLINNNIKVEKLFLQVDYIYNFESGSTIVSSECLPYIRNNEIIRAHLEAGSPNYFENYYMPFYRYATHDYKIGFREFFSSAINKKSKIDFDDGFVPKEEQFTGDKNYKLPDSIIEHNKIFESIDQLCKANNIDVVYFCAPFCSTVRDSKYIDQLKAKIPTLKDYSKFLEDKYFYNCGHLNKKGAEIFTEKLVNDFLNEK